jgi:hypothetical protein
MIKAIAWILKTILRGISKYPFKQKFVNLSFAKGADLYATGGKAERGKRQD